MGKPSLSKRLGRAATALEARLPCRATVQPDSWPPKPRKPSAGRDNLPSLSPPFQVGPSPRSPGGLDHTRFPPVACPPPPQFEELSSWGGRRPRAHAQWPKGASLPGSREVTLDRPPVTGGRPGAGGLLW